MSAKSKHERRRGRPRRDPRWDGDALATWRCRANITLAELSRRLGAEGVRAPTSTIWSWEAGEGTPTEEARAVLARVLGCGLEDFRR